MHQDPFPDPDEDDDQEPDGFGQADVEAGPEQGLFLCLPAEEFDLDQFAQSGPASDLPPGALLATLMDLIGGPGGPGLAGLSDDQLMGFAAAARRMESWVSWHSMAAVGEFGRRAAGRGPRGEFAADELADDLHLTWNSAAGQMAYAQTVADRLPRCFAALGAGTIHPVQLRIIEEETSILSPADAAKADAELAELAGTLTYGKLRSAAYRLVLRLDPDAVRRRKEAARRVAEVRRFRENSGNAGITAREMPSAEVIASWQHLEQRAEDLRDAGFPGTMDELRVRAMLDLLQERDSRAGLAGRDDTGPGAEDPSPGTDGTGPVGKDIGPSVTAQVIITVPWSARQDGSADPAAVDGFGLVDNTDAKDLLAAAARNPHTRWCVTFLNPDGTAAAHGCVPGRHPPPGAARGNRSSPGPGPPSGTDLRDWLRKRRVQMTPVARDSCDHEHAETGYRPSRKLQHLIRARNARCTAPGCGRPAARCDLDHTVAWDKGGRTCECGLAPLCRHHHHVKQANGWRLEQPEPGLLIWHTPSGRSYTTRPTQYLR
ncbi:MAG: DUF222 domain-containing protein [Streptosporangiaceae bacterium]